MKKCPGCTKDIPDSAMHCVFCGAKIDAPAGGIPGAGQAGGGSSTPAAAKTIMGYAAVTGDLLKNLQQKPAATPAPAPVAVAPPPAMAAPAAQPAPAPTPFAPPPVAQSAPAPFAPPPAAPFAPPPAAPFAPPPAAQPLGMAATMMAPSPVAGLPPPAAGMGGGMPPPGGLPPGAGAPFAMPPPAAPGPFAPPGGMPPAAAPAPFAPPPAAPFAAPPPAASGPQLGGGANFAVGANAFQSAATSNLPTSAATAEATTPIARPKFLASETHSRALSPVEPWAGTLRLVMLVFGALLVITFVAPWQTNPTLFSWKVLSDAPKASMKLMPIAIVVAGLLALVLGAAPASTRARGAGAAGAGALLFLLFGLSFVSAAGEGASFGWRGYAIFTTMVTGPAGLLLRAKYPTSMAARVLGTVAGVATLAAFIIPAGGQMPLKALKAMAEAPGQAKIVAYCGYLLLLSGAACLAVWMPASGTPFATLIAWVNIAVVPVIIAAGLSIMSAVGVSVIKAITHAPGATIFPAIWFAAASALLGYGLATLIGKSHEQAAG